MLKKALVYLLFATLALILTAAVAVFLILKLALAPGRDEWPARFQAGPVAVDVGVPTAIRLATSSWFAPWLAGRTLDTAHGPVRFGWNAASETLELDCAPCSATVPALGKAPIRLDSLRATVRRDAGVLSGMLEAAPPARPLAVGDRSDDGILRGRWTGRLTQQALHIDIHVARDADRALVYGAGARAGRTAARPHRRHAGAGRPGRPARRHLRAAAAHRRIHGRRAGHRDARQRTHHLRRPEPARPRQLAGARGDRGRGPALLHPSGLRHGRAGGLAGNQPEGLQGRARAAAPLSQQLAKILVTGGEQSADRKLRELLYAVEMEQTLGKARILQLYLDNAPWGARICGADAAARTYFKRPARNLEPAQAVWLAAMLNNPALAVRKWQQEGNINLDRAKWVAEGVRGISKAQRDALLRSVATARFAPPRRSWRRAPSRRIADPATRFFRWHMSCDGIPNGCCHRPPPAAVEIVALTQALRRRHAARRRPDRPAHRQRQLLLPARPVRLRQEHHAAHGGGPRIGLRRRHPAGQPQHHQPAGRGARHGDDVPELRAVSAPVGRSTTSPSASR